MATLRSALFVDFDNIFGGLMNLDREAGMRFAQDPGHWLDYLTSYGFDNGEQRRFLQRRVYLNPNGWVKDEEYGNESGRLYLQKFRPNLVRFGFQVIDTPALTARHKNAADIRIVIDVMKAIHTGLPFDELVLASSDADFTPLLHEARAQDKRLLVIAAGESSISYQNVADDFIDAATLVALTRSSSTEAPAAPVSTGDAAEDVASRIRTLLAETADPLHMATIGHLLVDHRTEIDRTKWFGAGGLKQFIAQIPDLTVEFDTHYLWDPNRHEPPTDSGGLSLAENPPPLIKEVCDIVDVPVLMSEAWSPLFATIAAYLGQDRFQLPNCTKYVRDQLSDSSHPVGRNSVARVVHVLSAAIDLKATPPPSDQQLQSAFVNEMVDRYESAGPRLGDNEIERLYQWFGLPH